MLTQIIPSYLYVQYQDEPTPDPVSNRDLAVAGVAVAGYAIAGAGLIDTRVSNLQAFINAYNSLAQGYLTDINALNLPIYTLQSGAMLDWVALGIYGVNRPSLSYGSTYTPLGVYNTVEYNVTAYSEDIKGGEVTNYIVTDDYFKRILTWNFYKGDGFQFNVTWLKRRVKRFLLGEDGIDFPIEETYDVSVTSPASNTFEITIADTDAAKIFEAALFQNVLNVPFQYTFMVTY